MPASRCENCLLRFRTHRSLFKHLHVCAEHAQSPAPPPPSALDKESPASERPPESDTASAAGLPFPLLESFATPTSASTGPFLPYLNPAPFGLSPSRLRPFLAAAPGPPASSAAVWKKSQGECRGGAARRAGWAYPHSELDPPVHSRCWRQPPKTAGRLRCALRCVQVTTRVGWRGFLSVDCWGSAVPAPFPGGQKCHSLKYMILPLKLLVTTPLSAPAFLCETRAPFTSERSFPSSAVPGMGADD